MTNVRQGPPVQCSVALKDAPTERILFESFPQAISEGYRANYQDRRGRTSIDTYAYYQGGKFSSFQLVLRFVAGLHPAINRRFMSGGLTILGEDVPATEDILDGIDIDSELILMESKVRWMQALCFPRPTRPRAANINRSLVLAGEPPRVLITIGRFMTIEGIAESSETTWFPPFHPVSARPYVGEVSLSFKRLGTFYPDWYDVKDQATTRTPSRLGTGATGVFNEMQPTEIPDFPLPDIEDLG